eukprot:5696203-Pyramimonas_sp.AAC.1
MLRHPHLDAPSKQPSNTLSIGAPCDDILHINNGAAHVRIRSFAHNKHAQQTCTTCVRPGQRSSQSDAEIA